MKKRLFPILMAILMVFAMMPMTAETAYAKVIEVGGIIYRVNDENQTASVTQHTENLPAEIEIPATVTSGGTDYSVKCIDESVFDGCDTLSKVVIKSGVEKIEGKAFSNCSSLIEIVIPASVTTMEKDIFYGIDTDGLAIRTEENSTAATYAQSVGATVIGFDDMIISLSMDESGFTKYTTAFTEIEASQQAATLVEMDPYSAGQFSVDRDRSGLGVWESGLFDADRNIDLDENKRYYICPRLVHKGETEIPNEEHIVWRYNGKITKPLLDLVGSSGQLAVVFELKNPPAAAAKYKVTVTNGEASPSEAPAGKRIALNANPAPEGKMFREWSVESGPFPEEIGVYSSNTGFIMPEGDIELTAKYVSLISAAGVHDVRKTLETDHPAAFSAAVDENYSDQVNIVQEKWESTDGSSVITNAQTGVPVLGAIYNYSLILEAKDGFGFGNNLSFSCDGQEAGITVAVREHGTKAEIAGLIPAIKVTRHINGANVSEIAKQVYTGSPLKPKTVVTYGNTQLVAGTDYDCIYLNNTYVGTATVVVKGKGNYVGTISRSFSISKAANPLTIKAKTATVKYSKLKKKAQKLAVTKVIKFTKKGQGKMNYTLVSAKKGSKSFKKKFAISKTNGKVTVKKGLKKGTYKVKAKVKAGGNTNYKASAVKTVTFTIKVK